jgi:hypothetical protein
MAERWTGGTREQEGDEAKLREFESRIDPSNKEQAGLLEEMRAHVDKLKAHRKHEDPRLSFSTPEFKEASRIFTENFKVGRRPLRGRGAGARGAPARAGAPALGGERARRRFACCSGRANRRGAPGRGRACARVCAPRAAQRVRARSGAARRRCRAQPGAAGTALRAPAAAPLDATPST